MDIELYSEEFHADLVSIWMDEMGVPQTPGLRKGFKSYRKFFNAKERRRWITMQANIPTTPAQLQMAVMAALAGLKEAKPNQIIKAVMKGGLSINSNSIYHDFVNYEIDEAFWRMVAQGTGYHEPDVDLGRFAMHILLTAATRTMRQEFLAGLDSFISAAHQAYCYDFVSDWLHSDDDLALHKIAEYVESEARLPQRFMKLMVDDLVDTEVFPCINEVIPVTPCVDSGIAYNYSAKGIKCVFDMLLVCFCASHK